MIKEIIAPTVLIIASSLLVACSDKAETAEKAVKKKLDGRWYTNAQRVQGEKVFKDNCAACHGAKGQGLVKNWKQTDASGKFPAPPLNGSAHAWHHSKDLLIRTVNEGGIALGGSMPPFKDKLTAQQKEAVLAHVMSLWPDKVYEIWQKRNPATK